jgi:hypothetical protein
MSLAIENKFNNISLPDHEALFTQSLSTMQSQNLPTPTRSTLPTFDPTLPKTLPTMGTETYTLTGQEITLYTLSPDLITKATTAFDKIKGGFSSNSSIHEGSPILDALSAADNLKEKILLSAEDKNSTVDVYNGNIEKINENLYQLFHRSQNKYKDGAKEFFAGFTVGLASSPADKVLGKIFGAIDKLKQATTDLNAARQLLRV